MGLRKSGRMDRDVGAGMFFDSGSENTGGFSHGQWSIFRFALVYRQWCIIALFVLPCSTGIHAALKAPGISVAAGCPGICRTFIAATVQHVHTCFGLPCYRHTCAAACE